MRAVGVVAVAPCPLLPLEEEGPGSRGSLLVSVYSVGGGGGISFLQRPEPTAEVLFVDAVFVFFLPRSTQGRPRPDVATALSCPPTTGK